MPDFIFEFHCFVAWLHFVALVIAGGAMPVCLILSGFEETHEDVRGISAVLWKKLAVWGMRCAAASGVALLIINLARGHESFSQPILLSLIALAGLLVWLCETAPKALGNSKRGTALLAMALFLVVSFIVTNRGAFAKSDPARPDVVDQPIAPVHQSPLAPPAPQEAPAVSPLES